MSLSFDKEKIKINTLQVVVKLTDGAAVPAIGQGTWCMGEKASEKAKEVAALRLGIELGMTLIDTAEMYGEGGAELVVGEAIKGVRDQVFLVSKVYPHNAGKQNALRSCENSLKRLGADYLDLYLLHWRGGIPLAETVEVMEQLRAAGKIKRWGVSNLDTDDMQELWQLENGQNCATNQVLYHLGSRGIEFDLLPWCGERSMPVMAYCPIAQGGQLRKELLASKTINEIAQNKGCTVTQLLLAWCIRSGEVIAIPKASSEQHVYENAQASSLILTQEELGLLDSAFAPPTRKIRLDIV